MILFTTARTRPLNKRPVVRAESGNAVRHHQTLTALATCAALFLGGMATASAATISLEADRLKVDESTRQINMNGRAHATEGPLLIRGDTMTVTLAPGAKPDGGRLDGKGITLIEAGGWVHVMIKDKVTADGQWARYDPATHVLTMGDSVTLWQDGTTSKGSKLTLDTATGKTSLSGDGKSTKGDALPPPWMNERAK